LQLAVPAKISAGRFGPAWNPFSGCALPVSTLAGKKIGRQKDPSRLARDLLFS